MTREPDISLSTERLLQCQEALGQLQQARAEIARLTAALKAIADYTPGKDITALLLRSYARAALEPKS